MPQRFRPATLVVAAALSVAAHGALADVYTWTDVKGRVNVSNLAPPEGVRVTNVVHESPPTAEQIEARREAARLAEVQALNDRVRQLEYEVEWARQSAPAQPAYAAAPPPSVVQINAPTISQPAPYAPQQPMPYWPAMAQANTWCDPMWISCGAWLGPQLYPAFPAIVVRSPGFRRHAPVHGGRPVVNPRPVNPPPNPRKR